MQDVCGPKEKTFKVENPCRATKKYTIQVGDEAIVAPLSLFHTELLNITGTGKKARVQNASYADHEDCFDSKYLRETGVGKTLLIYTNYFSMIDSIFIVFSNVVVVELIN